MLPHDVAGGAGTLRVELFSCHQAIIQSCGVWSSGFSGPRRRFDP
jgi:hypothetical protein